MMNWTALIVDVDIWSYLDLAGDDCDVAVVVESDFVLER